MIDVNKMGARWERLNDKREMKHRTKKMRPKNKPIPYWRLVMEWVPNKAQLETE